MGAFFLPEHFLLIVVQSKTKFLIVLRSKLAVLIGDLSKHTIFKKKNLDDCSYALPLSCVFEFRTGT